MNTRFERKKPESAEIKWLPGTQLIWHPDYAVYYEQPKNQFCYFRKTFELSEACLQSEFRIIVDTKYKLYVNGQFIGRGPSRFDLGWAYYDVFDLTPFLKKGKNVIAVFALFHGYGTGAQVSNIQMLLANGEFQLGDKTRFEVKTDQSWKCILAPQYSSDVLRLNGRQGPMEVQDTNQSIGDWQAPDFDDSEWRECAVIMRFNANCPWYNLIRRDIPQLKEEYVAAEGIIRIGRSNDSVPDVMQMGNYRDHVAWTPDFEEAPFPVSLQAHESCAIVANIAFEKIVAGYLEMDVYTETEAVIDVMYAESLWEGFVPTTGRIPCDRFILKPGKNRLGVNFGWKAFRFVQLWIWTPSGLTIEEVRCNRRLYPLPDIPLWKTDRANIDAIIELAMNSLRLCMQDGFLDSSSREQQQWMGDGGTQAQVAAYCFGETKLWKRMLKQIVQSQDWMGTIMPRHPGRHQNIAPIPSFMLDWIFSSWDFYCYTQNADLLTEFWNNMVQTMRWFSAFENSQGILENVPHWMYIDWGGMDVERRGILPALNSKYYHAVELMVAISKKVKDSDATAFYTQKKKGLAERIVETCWSEERGCFPDCRVDGIFSGTVGEATNSLALLYLPLEVQKVRSIIRSIFEIPEQDEKVVKASPAYILHVGRALNKHGYASLALRKFEHRFQSLLDADATAIWEHWNILSVSTLPSGQRVPHISSASHGWGAGFLVFFADAFLGTELTENGLVRSNKASEPFSTMKATIFGTHKRYEVGSG